MIVLGIDPGTAMLGYGIVERSGSRLRMVDVGCLETSASESLPARRERPNELPTSDRSGRVITPH